MPSPRPTTWTVRAFRDAETAQVWAEDRGFLDHLHEYRLVDFDATAGTIRVLHDDPMTPPRQTPRRALQPPPPPPQVTATARDSREQARRIRLQMEEERRSKQGPSDLRRAAVDANGVRLFTIARLTEVGVDPAAAVVLAGIGIVPPLAPEVRRPF